MRSALNSATTFARRCLRWGPVAMALNLTFVSAIAHGQQRTPEGSAALPEDVVQWGVQKGDTCEDIAHAVYGDARHARLVMRYNRVVCTPGAPLKQGLTLILPAKATTVASARINSMVPKVKARPAGGGWGDAATGQSLPDNSGVRTGEAGRANIHFIDRTRIALSENTIVVIYGTASQTAVAKVSPPAAVEVDQGEVKAAFAALRGDAIEVGVPGGGRVSAASRDTVIARTGDRTTVSVFDGKAKVQNAGKSVDVPAAFGTRFTGTTAPEKPRPLPSAPVWDQAPPSMVFAAGANGVFEARWLAVPRAKAYRVELARDAAFEDLIAREEVGKKVLTFRAEKLVAGEYHFRVRTLDQDDFLGLATRASAIDVVEAKVKLGAPGARAIELASGGAVVVNPYGALDLSFPLGTRLAIDDGAAVAAPHILELGRLRPTRLRFERGAGSMAIDLRYVDVKANITLTSMSRADGSQAPARTRVTVQLEGVDGISADRIKPRVRVERRGAVMDTALVMGDDGRLTAIVETPGSTDRIEVVDGWGRLLGSAGDERSAPVAPGVSPSEEALVRPVLGAVAIPWAVDSVVPRWWSPTAETAFSVSAGLEQRFEGDAPNGQVLVQASGNLGPLSMDASVRSDDTSDGPGTNEFAWLGLRYRMYQSNDGLLQVGAGLRGGMPSTSDAGGYQLETGIALGGRYGIFTWLVSTDFDLDGDTAAFRFVPSGAAGVALDPLSWLRVFSVIDAYSLRVSGALTDVNAGGGLTLGAEAGHYVFGSLAVRVTPFDAPFAAVAAHAALGFRMERAP